ncbi:hypothetical protein [Reichenbachiella versicolor]|uniref:hypothetical protein n=1 Tax=Reichenbachiella versicolor TaxID=1821036 RepID=UPI000D6E1077|nr:hypothetical protein [Reichenbachiella versicolor]
MKNQLTQITYLLSILFISFLVSCGGDEESNDEEAGETISDFDEVAVSSEELKENVPTSVLSDPTYGALIDAQIESMAAFVTAQSLNLSPAEDAAKAGISISKSMVGCFSGSEPLTGQYTWSYGGFGYTLAYGEDESNYYWLSDYTGDYDDGSGTTTTVTYTTNSVTSKTGFNGCIYYELDGTQLAKMTWSTNTAGDISFVYDFGTDMIELKINADGSGYLKYSTSTYQWDASGVITTSEE